MKYIPVLNEEWLNDLLSDYETAFKEIYYKLSRYNNTISRDKNVIKATPVKIGKKEYPFPFAEKLEGVYQWLVGNKKKPKDLDEIMDDIMSLIWFNPFLDYTELAQVEWERWSGLTGAYTGQFYRFMQIANSLEKKESVNATDLALISGLSAVAIGKQIKEGKIKAEKSSSGWIIKSEEAIKWIDNQGKKNSKPGEAQIEALNMEVKA